MKTKNQDKHKPNYFKNYRKNIIEETIQRYGNKCSCINCILPEGHRPLIIVPDNKQMNQYSAALYLRKNGYKKNLAKLYCQDCWPSCNHAYDRLIRMKMKFNDCGTGI